MWINIFCAVIMILFKYIFVLNWEHKKKYLNYLISWNEKRADFFVHILVSEKDGTGIWSKQDFTLDASLPLIDSKEILQCKLYRLKSAIYTFFSFELHTFTTIYAALVREYLGTHGAWEIFFSFLSAQSFALLKIQESI